MGACRLVPSQVAGVQPEEVDAATAVASDDVTTVGRAGRRGETAWEAGKDGSPGGVTER